MKSAFYIAMATLILFLFLHQKSPNNNGDKIPNSIQADMAMNQDSVNTISNVGAKAFSQTAKATEDILETHISLGKTAQIKIKNDIEKGKKEITDTLKYEVDEDGLVTVDGDIVLGAATNGSGQGEARVSDFQLWPQGRVPFFIQGDLEERERIIKALAMFVDTPIQFIPYQGEEDVLVFESAKAGCKSYLGKVGGKQPVWISPQCGVTEIAHEIMHALGFIHEQNRTDRDSFVRIEWDNIEESKRINFEIFPEIFMSVSGKTTFDFQSIMIYQPTAFTKNGLNTMVPVKPLHEIAPSHGLSEADLFRLSAAYSH